MRRAATYLPPRGSMDARYVFVSSCPSWREFNRKRYLAGPSEEFMNKVLEGKNISACDCYWTAAFKEVGRWESFIQFEGNGAKRYMAGLTPVGQMYVDELRAELRRLKPKAVCAMGALALYALTGRKGIMKWRGSILDCSLVHGIKVVPVLDPYMAMPPAGSTKNKWLIAQDLKWMQGIVEGTYVPTVRDIIIGPSFHQSRDFLLECERRGVAGDTIGYDIEVGGDGQDKYITCISFAYGLTTISIPILSGTKPYFSKEREAFLWRLIGRLLENPKIEKVGQNISFDGHFLLRVYGIRSQNLHDTMVASNILTGDFGKGLDFITSVWTDHPYYKEDGKEFFKGATSNLEKFWTYNAADSVICTEALEKMRVALEESGNLETYERQRSVIPALVYMQEKGMKADVELMFQRSKELEAREEELLGELAEIAGRPLSQNSPKQLREYFIEELKCPKYKGKSKSKSDCAFDDVVMTRYKRNEGPGSLEAALIIEARKVRKLRGTYYDVSKVDKDGRVRCSFNPAGTRFSRLASRGNIFGTGINFQNVPHSVRDCLRADSGYLLFAPDLSQAENRIVAYEGNIPEMIDCFETGKDVHSLTGALVHGVPYAGVSREKGTSMVNPTESQRWDGKKCNHSLNYDIGPAGFALALQIKDKLAKELMIRYHKAYPGVRNSYQRWIRSCLRKDKTVPNAYGRRTLFYGDPDDQMFKMAYACPTQGLVGDIMLEVMSTLWHDRDRFGEVELLNQVHDEVVFQLPVAMGWERMAATLFEVKKIMEVELTAHNGNRFTLPSDFMMNNTFGKGGAEFTSPEMDEMDIGMLAGKLEEEHGKLQEG